MASSSPGEMDLIVLVPSRVTSLGNALAPVARSLREMLAIEGAPSGKYFVVLTDLPRHMGLIHQALTHLAPKLEDLMESVVRNEGATMADSHRAAGRLEQVISEFMDGFHDAQSSCGTEKSAIARNLLIGVYQHHILEICDWLEDLVQAIANPNLALKRSGVVDESTANLSVVLKMTNPPQMEKLRVLWDAMLPKSVHPLVPEPSYKMPEVQSPGLFGTLCAMVFGLGLSKAIFVGKHEKY